MTEKLRRCACKYPALAAIIMAFLALALFHLDVWFFKVDFFATICHTSPDIAEAIKRFIVSALLFLFIIRFMKNSLADAGYSVKNLGLGLKKGILVILFPILISGSKALDNIINGAGHFAGTTEEKLALITVIIQCISVGIFEETAYRAVPINLLRNKKGLNERKQMFYALTISSALFGLIHLSNFFGGYDSFFQCLGRIINAFGFGMFLGAIYWTTGSMLTLIIIHFIWDGISMMLEALYVVPGSSGPANVGGVALIPSIFLCIFYILLALFIVRKKKFDGCKIKALPISEQNEVNL